MRVAASLGLLVLLVLLIIGLWAAFASPWERPVHTVPEPGAAAHRMPASHDVAADGGLLRQPATASVDAPLRHRLILESDQSDRIPNQALTLWGDGWWQELRTDHRGVVDVPAGAPRLLHVAVAVPLLLKTSPQFEAVPGGVTRVVVHAVLDTIAGVVLDPRGTPIEGVAVCGSRVAVATDAAGSFSMPRYGASPSEGESLYCSKDGYQPLQTSRFTWGSRGVVVTLSQMASVTLSVRRVADGKKVQRFFAQRGHLVNDRLKWSAPVRCNGEDHVRLTDLVDGRNILRVWPGTTTDWAPGSTEILVHEGSRSYQACVDVVPSRAFDVVVKNDRGDPIEGCFVATEEWTGNDEPAASIISDASRHQWRELNSAISNADGEATLAFGPEECFVRIEKTGYATTRHRIATYVSRIPVTLQQQCKGSVVGTQSVLTLLQTNGWHRVSIAFVSPATATVTASVWSEADKTAEVAPGTYTVVALGTIREERLERRCSVQLGTVTIDRPGWLVNVEAMREEWRVGTVRAQFVCDGAPARKAVIRLRMGLQADHAIPTMTPLIVTDAEGFASFAAPSGDYQVSVADNPNVSGSLSVPARGAEVTGVVVALK